MYTEPTEKEIQEVIELLKKTHPNDATREKALQTIESMRSIANMMIDRIDEDLKSGKVKVNDKGEILRDGKDITKVNNKSKKA